MRRCVHVPGQWIPDQTLGLQDAQLVSSTGTFVTGTGAKERSKRGQHAQRDSSTGSLVPSLLIGKAWASHFPLSTTDVFATTQAHRTS